MSDASIPPALRAVIAAHDAAVSAGKRFYRDPASGLLVMTELAHLKRGHCCGSGCRHCPFPADEQRAAGRPTIRGEG